MRCPRCQTENSAHVKFCGVRGAAGPSLRPPRPPASGGGPLLPGERASSRSRPGRQDAGAYAPAPCAPGLRGGPGWSISVEWLEHYTVVILPALMVAEQLGILAPAVPAFLGVNALAAGGRVNMPLGVMVTVGLAVDLAWYESRPAAWRDDVGMARPAVARPRFVRAAGHEGLRSERGGGPVRRGVRPGS